MGLLCSLFFLTKNPLFLYLYKLYSFISHFLKEYAKTLFQKISH